MEGCWKGGDEGGLGEGKGLYVCGFKVNSGSGIDSNSTTDSSSSDSLSGVRSRSSTN